MRVLGLTGGIATGKSTAARLWTRLDSQAVFFDADVCVSQLYKQESVLSFVRKICGEEAVSGGVLNRDYVRARMFAEVELRNTLQNLIHPLVRKECLATLENTRMKGVASSFIADVPLLFEGGFDFGQDANLVVAVSRKTQELRLKMRSGFDDATVHAILAAQLPISQKEKCADVVFWNEGSISVLEAQIQKFINNHYE